MVSLQNSTSLLSSSSSKISITSSISGPKYFRYPKITVPKLPNHVQKQQLIEELNKLTTNLPLREPKSTTTTTTSATAKTSIETIKLYTILESVSDRIEMHQNIGDQRENWNSLLLNSVNMITLTAVTMAGLAEASGSSNGFGLKVSSTLLFVAGTGLLLVMNKIQPSQLVEEQRNAVRLFKRLQNNIQTTLSVRKPSREDVEVAMAKVLALDRAYPLPLLGAMIDKYPESLQPAVWWPSMKQSSSSSPKHKHCDRNGWTRELEDNVREIVGVTKTRDIEDYIRLGNKALKLSKMLAVSGPLLTGIAAVGAAGGGQWGGLVAAVAGSMAAAVNTVEHGGQVGMVFEMYRNCAGFFKLLEETVESTLNEEDLGKRENGEVFELKMALHLGRSLSELRDFAEKSRRNEGSVDEFASKLF
ncbi:hypothetical protein SOVF_008200 [Spinacia oleracea]|uniref:Probable F-box protein At4g22030 n=1 Tax=Spinacia oleracea TaxID=3562 RepID=A0A9R0HUS4_SPIOL|nr:probable F-box protein At4g22030 [Spinacia oleracea]KNA25254.1 hypothetical protein SOVF_008200 [Spinacia oleracea]